MVKMHKPAILVLLETKMADRQTLAQQIEFDMVIQSPVVGTFGEIVFMWKEDLVVVKVSLDNPQWFFSAVYASNILMERKLI